MHLFPGLRLTLLKDLTRLSDSCLLPLPSPLRFSLERVHRGRPSAKQRPMVAVSVLL